MPFFFPIGPLRGVFRRSKLFDGSSSSEKCLFCSRKGIGEEEKRQDQQQLAKRVGDYFGPNSTLSLPLPLPVSALFCFIGSIIFGMTGHSNVLDEPTHQHHCRQCSSNSSAPLTTNKKPLNIESLRKPYLNREEPFLLEQNMLACPFAQFDQWFKNVVAQTDLNSEEVNAFALSTVNSEGRPSSRMLLLKAYNQKGGFVFFTHSNSRKGKEMSANPYVSALFYWPKVGRQVRIEGQIQILEAEIAANYWRKRPIAARIGSKLSDQSSVISDRKYLEQKQRELEELLTAEGEEAISKPADWLGYALRPNYFEFWQGQSNRVHDRIIYTPNDAEYISWSMKRLAP